MSVKEQRVPLAPSSGRVNLVGAATHSVDLDTLDSVRYKMRSFLVGEPTASLAETPDHLTVGWGAAPTRFTRPGEGAVAGGAAAHYIPAYRLFETKRYDGPKDPSTGRVNRVGAAAHCCICLSNIRKGAMVVSMPLCGHLYHKACLFNWVDLSKNTFCPYCRQDDF